MSRQQTLGRTKHDNKVAIQNLLNCFWVLHIRNGYCWDTHIVQI